MCSTRSALLLEHSSSVGGAAVSLRALARAVDPSRFAVRVALAHPSDRLRAFYAAAEVETIDAPGIVTFEHTTARWTALGHPESWPIALRTCAGWLRAEERTLELVRATGPDLVHLSSVVLYPSARALHRAVVPFVWHVREMPVHGHGGLRTGLMRQALRRWPAEALFISQEASRAWMGEAPGTVVGEPVDLARFDPSLDRDEARRALGIPRDARVVLYGGGNARIKGVLPLLEAMAGVRAVEPRAVCLMPGGELARPTSVAYGVAAALLPLVGSATLTQAITSAIRRHHLEPALLRRPFTDAMEVHLAASDVVVFPSLVDHFARPVVEAAAMARPVVASRFPMIAEQIVDGETGILVPPGDPSALATAILRVLGEPGLGQRLAQAARAALGRRFEARAHADGVMAAWDRSMGAHPAGGHVR